MRQRNREEKSPGSGTPENFTDIVYRGKIRVEEKIWGAMLAVRDGITLDIPRGMHFGLEYFFQLLSGCFFK